MADADVLDKKAVEKQAQAGNDANADYGRPVQSPDLIPQLPDYDALAEQRTQGEGLASDHLAEGPYENVEIKDDGTRVGTEQAEAKKK